VGVGQRAAIGNVEVLEELFADEMRRDAFEGADTEVLGRGRK